MYNWVFYTSLIKQKVLKLKLIIFMDIKEYIHKVSLFTILKEKKVHFCLL